MPGEEAAGDRTEEATPRRREKERERGRVAKSRDLSAAAVMLGGMLMLRYGGTVIYGWIHIFTARMIGEEMANKPMPLPDDEEILLTYGLEWLMWTAHMLLPFLLALFVIALAVNLAQVGFLFSWDPLMPNLSKLNPINGLQRMFGLRSLMTLVFNMLKLAAVFTVAYITMTTAVPQALHLAEMMPAQILASSGLLVATMGLRLALLFFVLGVADFGYQIYQQNKDMMMSKQEVREEFKEVEGDPQIKARRRQIQRQLAMQRMMQEVPEAEVVVRNPTHFAVAIRYKPDMEAPLVVAKGADRMAMRILDVARANRVPCVERPELARLLYRTVEVGDPVPQSLYSAIAEILAYVLRGDKLAQYKRMGATPAAAGMSGA